MPGDVTYVHHYPEEFQAFSAPDGMVGRWARRKGEEVAAHAIVFAPKPGQGRGYATGETAANIRVDGPTLGRSGPEVDIVAHSDHALIIHKGTPPHIIKPRFAKKLVFFWRKAGRVVFKNSVRHPGTSGNPFLVRALEAVFGGPGR